MTTVSRDLAKHVAADYAAVLLIDSAVPSVAEQLPETGQPVLPFPTADDLLRVMHIMRC